MKYEKEVIETITHAVKQLHEDWMDEDDKKELLDVMIALSCDEMDMAIQVGIDNGYSLETQMNLMKRTRFVNGEIKIVVDQPNSEIMIN